MPSTPGILPSSLLWFFSTCRSEEHTSELQSLMRISYAVFCLKKKKKNRIINKTQSKKNKKHAKHTNSHEKKTKKQQRTQNANIHHQCCKNNMICTKTNTSHKQHRI